MLRPALMLMIVGWVGQAVAEEKPPGSAETFYRLQGKRNPFQPPAGTEKNPPAETAGSDAPKLPARFKEPLEAFQLDSLKLVAILRSTSGWEPAAMVKDPQGRGHLIRVGFRIGMREGVITSIEDGVVTIREPSPSPTGEPRNITLRLQEEKKP
ncbi:MAG: pilus assembly protein PilP [Magnetococcales bacterium]|nr:pilus assembly protein PilP [Magnetococcales bacterium]